ncbi:keratin-like protein KRT222 isoform X2 [Rhinoraja longicauda]
MEVAPLLAHIKQRQSSGRAASQRQVCGAGREAEDERCLQKARAELEDARRQWLGVQRETLVVRALQKGLEQSLQASVWRHERQRRSLAKMVGQLEHELKEVRGDIEDQVWQNQLLLNTKVRLEGEIGRYRSLLDKEEGRLSSAAAVGSASSLSSCRQKQVTLPSVPAVEGSREQRVEMVATQEILGHNTVAKSSKARGKIQTERVDEVIKEWECSFFKDNPHLRKKSASLRFDLHLAATEEGGCRGQQSGLPDIELRLVMRKSSSIPSLKS